MLELKDDEQQDVSVLIKQLEQVKFADVSLTDLDSGWEVPETIDQILRALRKLCREPITYARIPVRNPKEWVRIRFRKAIKPLS